jgi:hypothetical protein
MLSRVAASGHSNSSPSLPIARGPADAAVIPTPSFVCSLMFFLAQLQSSSPSLSRVAVPNLEGWMQFNVTKEQTKKFKSLKKGWGLFWFRQETAKLAFSRKQDEESLGHIEFADIASMETGTDPEVRRSKALQLFLLMQPEKVAGQTLRLLIKGELFIFSPSNAEQLDYWMKGLTACRKRFGPAAQNSASSSATAPATSPRKVRACCCCCFVLVSSQPARVGSSRWRGWDAHLVA